MQLTVEILYELCKEELKKGNGNKKIILATDDEGNSYRGMFYGFTPAWDGIEEEICSSRETDVKKLIVLG